MKTIIYTLFLALIGLCSHATEFKGQTYSIPRIAGETPRPNAYTAYSPAQEDISPEPVVEISELPSLRITNTVENDEPGYRSSVFDRPAMTR